MRIKRFNGALLSTFVIALVIAPVVSLLSSGPAHAALTTHNPILIVGNDNFTLANGVVGGSGTENDPYIIENWDVSAGGTSGISIENTTAHFVIRNCHAHDGSEGVILEYVMNGKIDNVMSNNNDQGIRLYESDNNIVTNSLIENNTDGIYSWYSKNNIFSNNVVGNNSYRGIELAYSDNNILRNNSLSNNTHNLDAGGDNLSQFYQDIDNSNTVNGKPIYYIVEKENLTFDGSVMDIGFLDLVSCENILVKNLNIGNSGTGILLANTFSSIIINSVFENNFIGIYSWYSDNNLISGNTMENNGYGIYLNHSDNSLIENNITKNNDMYHGIALSYSDNNCISNNTTKNNHQYGIYLGKSKNNQISNNTVENNGDHGFYLESSENNLIYHNNIVNSTSQAYDTGTNYWDNGYPSGGNYWGDYTGADNYHGENQNILGGDGIGDTPYNISGGSNQDRYPLIVRGVLVSISPSSQENENGKTLAYTVTITNTGNVQENFQLTKGDNADWTLSLDNTWILVPNGENRTTKLTVNIPSNAAGGTWDNIWVKATSKDNASVFDNESCLAHVKVAAILRGVQVVITPPSQENVNGGTPKYDVLVKNLGNAQENFQLTAGDNSGWTVSLDNAWLSVPSGDNMTTKLTVNIPTNAVGGTWDNIWVKATSKDNASVFDNESCLAHVKVVVVVRGVRVNISPTENSAGPGGNVTFSITVTNTGNVADNYSLTVGDNSGWGPTLSENSLLNVENGVSRTVTLTITIPASAENHAQDRITVTARSRTHNAIENNTTCTATATKAAPSGGVSPLLYVGVAVVIVVIIAAVLIIKVV